MHTLGIIDRRKAASADTTFYGVARQAEKASNQAGVVAMVSVPFASFKGAGTHSAHTVLTGHDVVNHFGCKPGLPEKAIVGAFGKFISIPFGGVPRVSFAFVDALTNFGFSRVSPRFCLTLWGVVLFAIFTQALFPVGVVVSSASFTVLLRTILPVLCFVPFAVFFALFRGKGGLGHYGLHSVDNRIAHSFRIGEEYVA